jgi:xylose isomerase
VCSRITAAIRADGRLAEFVKNRYATFDVGIGAKIERGEVGFDELAAHALENGEPQLASGRQEMIGNIINEFI